MRLVSAFVLLCGSASFLYADTLYLRDGSIVDGTFLSGTSREIRFVPSGSNAQSYPISSVINIIFGRNTAHSASTHRDNRDNGNQPYGNSNGERARVVNSDRTIPDGTVVTVRTIDSINSDKTNVGDTYRASLEEPLVVNGREVAPRGADATVQVVRVQQGGAITGSEEVALRLSEIRANGITLRPVTSDAEVASKSRGSQSAKVIGGTAVVGAIIGAIAGGGTGAAIGAAAGAGTGAAIQAIRGQRIQIPSESTLDFRLTEPLTF